MSYEPIPPDASVARLKRWLELDDGGDAAATFVPDEEYDAEAAAVAATLRAIADETASLGARRVASSPVKMAARSLPAGDVQSGVEVTVEGISVRFREDSNAVIHLAGAVPEDATHVLLGSTSFALERLADNELVVPALLPSTVEDFLELHFVNPSRFPIAWVRT